MSLKELFQKYGGVRCDARGDRPVERGMGTEVLRESLRSYRLMLDTMRRPNGAPVFVGDLPGIRLQIGRFREELMRRGQPE